MTWQTKTEWAESLQKGDIVMTRFRLLITQEDPFWKTWHQVTVEYVTLRATSQSDTTVKLKEFPYSIDIFWIEPVPNTVMMPGN